MSEFTVDCRIVYVIEAESEDDARAKVEDGQTAGKSISAEVVRVSKITEVR